jgi:hypothetical protein
MKGKPKELILSVNVLPDGKHIGQLQKWVSINLNNHAPDSEKPRWATDSRKPHQENLKSLYIGVHIRVDMGW